MGRNKFKSAMRSSSSGGGRGRSPGAAMVDKQLLRRVEAFAAGGGSLEGDAVAEGLRTSYREYGRVKAGPFRSLVERALEVVQRRAAAMSAKDGADQPVRPRVLDTRRAAHLPTYCGVSGVSLLPSGNLQLQPHAGRGTIGRNRQLSALTTAPPR